MNAIKLDVNYIEQFVNSVPFYEGGKIGGIEQYGAALCLLRLHQINGINKKGKYDKNKLFRLLLDELSSTIKKYQSRKMGMVSEFIDDCLDIINAGIKLSSSKEELLGELATYSLENVANNSLQMLFARAEHFGVPLPEGSWEVIQQRKLMVKPNWVKFRKSRFVSHEEDRLIDYYRLKRKDVEDEGESEVKIFDGMSMLFWCPDFASRLVEKQKDYYEWKELKKIL